ncbi:MAG: alpha/beta fold hydrolase [Chthoniobacterales bacterium]
MITLRFCLLALLLNEAARCTVIAAPPPALPRRAHLGLVIHSSDSNSTPQLPRVRRAEPNSLAAELDIRPGDSILAVNGRRLTSTADFAKTLRTLRGGERVRLMVERSGKSRELEGLLLEEPRENIPGVEVLYDSIKDTHDEQLRTIITRPPSGKEKFPVIFVAGWLSDDSIEAPDNTKSGTGLIFRALAKLPGFATMRMDKPGVGDSEGDCAETDFETELAGYRAAFASLTKYDFIDPHRVYIVGVSNGGGFAPLIASTESDAKRIRGYVVAGGWVKTWFEHMMEIERRRLTFEGRSPEEVNNAMKGAAAFYTDYLINEQTPGEILKRHPDFASLWSDDGTHQYGRPARFYHQLQRLNLAAAWSKVAVPTLAVHGEYDWIMSRADHEMIASYVNANKAGLARFVELAKTGHTLDHYPDMQSAFKFEAASFDPAVLQLLTGWFREQLRK